MATSRATATLRGGAGVSLGVAAAVVAVDAGPLAATGLGAFIALALNAPRISHDEPGGIR